MRYIKDFQMIIGSNITALESLKSIGDVLHGDFSKEALLKIFPKERGGTDYVTALEAGIAANREILETSLKIGEKS